MFRSAAVSPTPNGTTTKAAKEPTKTKYGASWKRSRSAFAGMMSSLRTSFTPSARNWSIPLGPDRAGPTRFLPVLVAGSLSLQDIVRSQGGLLGIFGWNLFHNPFSFFSFFLYFTAAQAETNQTPFDLPEAESELVSGYNVEYSGIRFGLFFLAEFGDMFIVAALATACFLGGWQVPFFNAAALPPVWGNLLSLGVFLGKAFLMVLVMMWVRWTLPRLRVDQLMRMSWKYMVRLTFVTLLGVSLWLLVFQGKGIPGMIASLFG